MGLVVGLKGVALGFRVMGVGVVETGMWLGHV